MKLDERFNERRAQLGENDLYIWQYISTHRKECASLSIEALGAKCNVSRSTILRFAQKLGLTGFSELRLMLRMEAEERPAPAAGFLFAPAAPCGGGFWAACRRKPQNVFIPVTFPIFWIFSGQASNHSLY